MSDQMPNQHERDLAEQVGMYNQPDPVPNDSPSMHDLVMQDIEKRKEFGLRKYGTLLQAGNGRDALQDSYEEALDLVVYLKQSITERNAFFEKYYADGANVPVFGTKIHETFEQFFGENAHSPYPVAADEVVNSPQYQQAYEDERKRYEQQEKERGKVKAWDIVEAVRKAFATHGSGSAPLIFKDEDGNHYDFIEVKADKKLVVVQIKRV